jgi:hypothetical protein
MFRDPPALPESHVIRPRRRVPRMAIYDMHLHPPLMIDEALQHRGADTDGFHARELIPLRLLIRDLHVPACLEQNGTSRSNRV